MRLVLPPQTLLAAACWAALPGCLWIGAGERSERLGMLDEDGDGVLAADEIVCGEGGDLSPRKAPGNEEVAYDGIDNDCQGGDLIDADSDGFPGISRADYEALLAELDPVEREVWPEGLGDPEVDCLDDPAAGGAAVNPGVSSDQPYDGTDADCGRDNEFDLDGDGYIKRGGDFDGDGVDDLSALYDRYLATYNYNFPGVAPGDCDDDDDAVNPGVDVADDLPYDGVDSDCADNNDFDADGDGYFPTAYTLAFQDYLATFGGGVPWAGDQPGDCFDTCLYPLHLADGMPTLQDDNQNDFVDFCEGEPFPVDPAAVFPGAADAPYDAVDGNCDQANDFDQDADGYTGEAFGSADVGQFVAWWGGDSLGVKYADCDDADAGVNPGMTEVLDNQDQDCFEPGDAAGFSVYDGGYWTAPGQVEVVHTGARWVLTVPASSFDWTGVPNEENTFLLYDFVPGTNPAVSAVLVSREQVHDGNDVLVKSTNVLVTNTYTNSTAHLVNLYEMAYVAGFAYVDADYLTTLLGTLPAANDVSTYDIGTGGEWTGGCGDGVVYLLETATGGRKDVAPGLADATGCLVEESGGEPLLTACNTTTCASYAFDASDTLVPVTPAPEWQTGGWARVERNGDVVILVPPSGSGLVLRDGGTDTQFLVGEEVVAADAVAIGNDYLIAAVLADAPNNRVILFDTRFNATVEFGFRAWPDPNGGPPISGNPTDVAIGQFGGQVMVAAAAEGPNASQCETACSEDDQVGWLLLDLN